MFNDTGSPFAWLVLVVDILPISPVNSGLNGSDFALTINNGNTYQSWSSIQAAGGSTTVNGAYVIADGDQAPGATDVITGLKFGGHSYN